MASLEAMISLPSVGTSQDFVVKPCKYTVPATTWLF